MLQVVKTMYYYINDLKKKVFVHCHAGYGRTGTTIACYKIFDECISAEAARDEIRKVREKSIQNRSQFNYCVKFQEYIRRLKGNFLLKEKRSIENFLKYQDDLNIGKYKFINFKYNKSVPLFLIYIFDSLIDIKNKTNIDELTLYNYLNSSLTKNETDSELMNTIIKNVNNYNWDILYSCEEPLILKELLFDWLTNSIEYVFNPENISKLNENLSNFDKELKTCEYQTLLIIVKFIKLIQDKDEDKEIENQRKIFIENISKYFLGYTSEEDENKNEILYNVYEQLKEHFENNPNKKKLEIEQDNENGDFFNKINNLMNSIRDLSINTPKKENDISNNDSINLRNFNSSTIQLSKTMKINLRKNKSLFRESIEVINEIEQNKDIPWIREEDC